MLNSKNLFVNMTLCRPFEVLLVRRLDGRDHKESRGSARNRDRSRSRDRRRQDRRRSYGKRGGRGSFVNRSGPMRGHHELPPPPGHFNEDMEKRDLLR